jgi:predicted RNA binding protein YcfA (HicA-like mRNA interferase family)
MDLSPKSLIKLLKQHGWELDRIKGSHHIFCNTETKQTLPVPIHGSKDLKLGTYMAILKMANIDKK